MTELKQMRNQTVVNFSIVTKLSKFKDFFTHNYSWRTKTAYYDGEIGAGAFYSIEVKNLSN